MLALGNLLMVGGIIAIFGVRTATVGACTVVVALSTALYVIAALRQRPRVIITPQGFTFEKLLGREAHQWTDIEGRFVVIKVGLTKAVAYKLTAEYKSRTGKKTTTLFSGYDAAVVGGALPSSPQELADLLNEHVQRNRGSEEMASPGEETAELGAGP
jgi:hypothetical protein